MNSKNVFDNAQVYDNARVYGSAQVYGNARVHSNAVIGGDARVYGNAVIGGDARVYGNAQVYDNAVIGGDAQVYGNAVIGGDGRIEKTSDYLILGPAKSSGRFTTAHRDAKIGVRVNCGCFSGTVREFSDAIERTHAHNPKALMQYRLFCQLIAFNFGVKE